jgi:hypothetical protein
MNESTTTRRIGGVAFGLSISLMLISFLAYFSASSDNENLKEQIGAIPKDPPACQESMLRYFEDDSFPIDCAPGTKIEIKFYIPTERAGGRQGSQKVEDGLIVLCKCPEKR